MQELTHKLERLITTKTINIETKDPGKIKHRGHLLLPLNNTEPSVGDLCRSIVVGKDESRRQLILHITFLLQGERSVLVNHLCLRGCIRDYDLKQEFSIFTYLGNFKQVALGSEIVAQVRTIVLRQEKKHFELTLKVTKQHKHAYFRPGVTKDQIEPAPRQWRLFEKFGHFSANFLAQYEEDFSNPGLLVRLCRDGRLRQNESLDFQSLTNALGALSLDYQRLIFGPIETVGRQALPRGTEIAESTKTGAGARASDHRTQLRQKQRQNLHRQRMRARQYEQFQRGTQRNQRSAKVVTQQSGSFEISGRDPKRSEVKRSREGRGREREEGASEQQLRGPQEMTCIFKISTIGQTHIIYFMQDNRFTYSPAVDMKTLLRPISFLEFQNPNTTSQQSLSQAALNYPNKYTPSSGRKNPFTSFVGINPPNRQITFGHATQTNEPVRITFNQNGITNFSPAPITPKPLPITVQENKKPDVVVPSLKNEKVGNVNTFVVDTNEFKYVKEQEFTGCFHCFSPVKFDTKAKKGLCG